jgi:PmbA protein
VNGTQAARHALNLADQRNLQAEAFYSMNREMEIRCFQGKVEHFERAESGGLGIRVISEGRSGLAYTEKLDEDSLAETLEAAREATEHLPPQEGITLSNWPAASEIKGLQAPGIPALKTEEKIQLALDAEAATRSCGPEIENVPWAGFSETVSEILVANTAGLERNRTTGSMTLFVQALAARDSDRKTHFDFCFGRDVTDLNPQKIGTTAGQTAISLLGANQPVSCNADILFGPRAFADILGTFSSQFSGRAAEEKRTPLLGRQGQQIGAENLQLIDDATLPGAPASRPFDAEGAPTARLALIEDGVFKSFMHSSETASRAGCQTTAHASRSYKNSPGVAPSNLMVSNGDTSPDDLRSAAGIEVIAVIGSAGASAVSGEFSLPMLGFELSNGQRVRPIHNFTVSGSFEGLLSAVKGIGNDFEFASPSLGSSVGCGSILVSGLAIAGSK